MIISEGVTEVGNTAFENCVNLENVTLPTTLLAINYASFMGCTKLNEFSIPFSVNDLGANVLYSSVINKLIIPVHLMNRLSSATGRATINEIHIIGEGQIPNGTLQSVQYSNSLTVGDGITSFGNNNISDFKEIHIGKGITSLGENYFTRLLVLTIDPENEHFRYVNGAFYSGDLKTLICLAPDNNTSDFTVLSGTKRLRRQPSTAVGNLNEW